MSRKIQPDPIVVLDAVSREYEAGADRIAALDQVSLNLERGRFVAVVGKSGSGQSTLLNLIAGIDRPTRGSLVVAGTALEGLDESDLAEWRGRQVGVVFQFFQLLPTLTILENVMLPMEFSGWSW